MILRNPIQLFVMSLKKYSHNLNSRPEVVVLTKTEGLDNDILNMQINELRKVVNQKLT